ncbi:hypothetical protein ACE939_09590 [Aquimarina sp. W85]|uniref:hypothetical protein n=1 Tax=Aquimarina rhodophyticola TaxID=3342246 RepID=UPI00366B0FDA
MKLTFLVYILPRIIFGLFLFFHGTFNVYDYSNFLLRLNSYFTKTTFFNLEILKALGPLVPFIEFIIGFFLLLDFFIKPVLWVATILFSGIILFLLDAKEESLLTTHIILLSVTLTLYINERYNLRGSDKTDSWSMKL